MTDRQQVSRRSKSLEQSLDYFEEHRDAFSKDHHGQFVLIHKGNVAGFFVNELEGYHEGKEDFGLGEFLLKRCIRVDEEVEIRFRSRVA